MQQANAEVLLRMQQDIQSLVWVGGWVGSERGVDVHIYYSMEITSASYCKEYDRPIYSYICVYVHAGKEERVREKTAKDDIHESEDSKS